MKPTLTDIHVSAPLTNVSVGWAMADMADQFVWPKAFPIVPVLNNVGVYYVWTEGDFLRIEARQRAPGATAVEGEVGLSTQPFLTEQYAIRQAIPKEVQYQADGAVKPDVAATIYTADNLMRRIEKLFFATCFTSSVWTDLVAGTDFTPFDSIGGDPVKDIQMNALVGSRKINGRKFNKLIVGAEADIWLRNNADIKDRVKYTNKGPVTSDLLAALFGVDEYLVASAVENTAAEGATPVYASIAGKSMLLLHSPPSAALNQPSSGYTIVNKSEPGTGANGLRTYDYEVPERHTRFIETQIDVTFEIVATTAGLFFPTVIS